METPQKTTPETAEAPGTMQLEWKRLQKRKQDILKAISRAKSEINELPENEEFKLFLQQESAQRKAIKEFLTQIKWHEENIERRKADLNRARTRSAQWHMNKVAENQKRFLGKSALNISLFNPRFLLKHKIMTENDLPIPSPDALRLFNEENAKDENAISFLQKSLKETEWKITETARRRNEMKKSRERELAEREESLRTHNAKIMQWATNNRCRLQWVLENQLLSGADIVSIYGKEHPDDDISDLLPANSPDERRIQYPPKARKKHSENISPPTASSNGTKNETEWKFFIGKNENGPWEEVSLEKIKSSVKIYYHPVDEQTRQLLFQKMARLTTLPPTLRRQKGKMKYVLSKFLKLRIRGYRLFHNIEEQEQTYCVKFYLKARGRPKCYPKK